MSQTIIVIGNGPSLRGFDFRSLEGFDTLGMNAAYRHWDRINWYPTYYCCLDDQLIKTHHLEIIRLVDRGQITAALVEGSFFEMHPDRLSDDRLMSLDEFIPYWNEKRGGRFNLRLREHTAFKTDFQNKVTTGSYAVRFASYLGYKRAGLLGIDLNYVEKIPEAEATHGIGLKMTKTPESNPNYFFDDYQQAGDLYNMPNPDVHDGDLHIAAFRAIRDDFKTFGVKTDVVNCNEKSELHHQNIFPLANLDDLKMPALSAVVVPCNMREVSQILSNLSLWGTAELAPFHEEPKAKPKLIFVFNNLEDQTVEPMLRSEFIANKLDRHFCDVHIHSLGLSGTADAYVRDYTLPPGEFGYKAGPNNQFFQTMRYCADKGRYAFLMEVDCIPIRRDWLGRLSKVVASSERFFIMGSAYRGGYTLSPEFNRHINGNAVYAVGDLDFQRFLSEFWEPRLRKIVADKDPRIAYDCALELVVHGMNSLNRDCPEWQYWKSHAHLFRYTTFIQNISAARDISEPDPDLVKTILREPDTFIIHSQAVARAAKLALHTGEIASERWTVQPPVDRRESGPPRTLILDLTPRNNGTATGELKASFFAEWPEQSFLQVFSKGPNALGLDRADQHARTFTSPGDHNELRKAIDEFDPELILYRPVPDAPALHAFAMETIKNRAHTPLVTWIVDDWPARLQLDDPRQFEALDADWKWLLDRSALRLSIGDAMSAVFKGRYGFDFEPFANGVNRTDWPAPRKRRDGPFVVRYAGALADNMTARSVLRVAEAIEGLAERGRPIQFEIQTMPLWRDAQAAKFDHLKHTCFRTKNLSSEEYRKWLSGGDAVVIGYNFDTESLRYIGLSMANKLPECLASGVPLIAHGPAEAATIAYLKQQDCALVVDAPDKDALARELQRLLDDAHLCGQLAAKGQDVAFSRHDIHSIRARFTTALSNVVKASEKAAMKSAVPAAYVANDRADMLSSYEMTDRCVVMGNGPSLKGFDFARLNGLDVFGMNAAYRHWDRINWYPQYYSCLDDVLGKSHAKEIRRLVENAHEYGIRRFLLRDNLIELLGDVRNRERIVSFDALQRESDLLEAPIYSTGSHTAAWAAYLGYREIFLLGIDCNYVELVDGARHVGGTELLIERGSDDNPNYFFSDYQQAGDRYNIPNPGQDVHLTSWRQVADRLRGTEARLFNANLRSMVDAFDFCSFEEVESGAPITPIPVDEIVGKPTFPREKHVTVDETEVVSRMLCGRIGRAHVMLDVGAHVGTSASYFDDHDWTIHCFEPDPKNRGKLVQRFEEKDNVTIDTRAVSDVPATGVPFFQSEESTGISGLHAFRDTHRETGRVDVTTVADVVKDRALDQIDFLKIDVEGFDFSVLKGVPWDDIQPDVIECEFEDHKTVPLGHTWRDVAQFLADKGYAVYLSEWHPIIRYGVRHDWRRLVKFPHVELAADSWGNILAFKTDPGFAAVAAAFEKVIARKNPGLSATVASSHNLNKAPARQPTLDKKIDALPSANYGGEPRLHAASRYQRFVLWARLNNPLVNRLGQFAVWTVRTARNHRNVSIAYAVVLAALIVGGFVAPSLPVAALSWGLAALLAAASLLVALIGFAGHLVQKGANETDQRLATLERQMPRLRTELGGRIEASEARLIGDVQDLVARLLELKAELARRLEQSEAAFEARRVGDIDLITQMMELKSELVKRFEEVAKRLEKSEAAIEQAKTSQANDWQALQELRQVDLKDLQNRYAVVSREKEERETALRALMERITLVSQHLEQLASSDQEGNPQDALTTAVSPKAPGKGARRRK